jgi:hypothetical protein
VASAFDSWIGQTVIVHLALGQIRLSLRGTVLSEKAQTLLMKAQYGPDLEVSKTNVLAIEEVWCPFHWRPRPRRWLECDGTTASAQ